MRRPLKRSRRFPETKASVPQARQFVAESLAPLVPEVCETATLLVSELATNAVVHASSEFDVTVVYPTPTGRVRIEVADDNPAQPTPLQPPPSNPHGRGLLLVATLSEEWGVREATRRAGKTIWFELAPAAAPATAPAVRARSLPFRRSGRDSSFFLLRPVGWRRGLVVADRHAADR
jgi:anti-sigma regulatory factor (Ser/Thr protein kinase)